MSGSTGSLIQLSVINSPKMNKSNRDLLVMFRHQQLSPQDMETEISSLHEMLFQVERLDSFVSAHELIDLNRYRIYRGSFEIKKLVRSRKEKSFVFLNNLN